MSPPPRQPAPEPIIRAGEVYSLREFARRLGWGEHSLRQARLAGLPVILVGREKYVRGTAAEAWFARLEAAQTGQLTLDQESPGHAEAKNA